MKKKYFGGFTLIELLVTIGVLAVVAAGVIALINPADKLNQANDAKVVNDIGQIATAIQSYATQYGSYPPNSGVLVPGEMTIYPIAPTGYTYTYTAYPNSPACTTACTSVVVTGTLKSTKYTSGGYSTWRFDTATGKSCAWNSTTSTCKS